MNMKEKRGQILKELRKRKGLNQSSLAVMLDVSQQAYQKYEYGTAEPTYDSLSKLADFYGVTTDYLLGRESPDKHPKPLELLSKQNDMDNAEEILFEKYLELPETTRKELIKMMYSFADTLRRNAENKSENK